VRRDEQPSAACGRQQPGCHGEQRAVTRAELRTLDVTAQDFELMAQHEHLMSLTSTVRPQRISSFSTETNAR
jgi:hypothetical protein